MDHQQNQQFPIDSPQLILRRSASLHKNKYLIDYLVQQIGISQKGAKILIHAHGVKTKAEVLDLLISNQNGYYSHVFIPGQKNNDLCEICQNQAYLHELNDQNLIKNATEQFDQENSLAFNQKVQSINSFLQQVQRLNKRLEFPEQQKALCQICYLNYDDQQMTQFNGRTHNICITCIGAYIQQKITSMEIGSINCPHCSAKLTAETIKKYVNQKIYSVYEQFIKNAEVQKNPNLMWCPNPKCSVVISIQKKKKNFKCPKCDLSICSKCHRQSHKGRSCDSVFKNQIKQWENSQKIQKCKKCSSIVQKVSGCNHMSCSICGYQWCWLCGADYSERHFNPMNPFGCAGLQDRHGIGKCRIILWRITLFILLLVGIPILIPFALLLSGPFVCIDTFYRKVRWQHNKLKQVLAIFCGFFVGLIFNPFIWIGLTVMYFPKGIDYIRQYFRTQRRRVENAENRLNQRLINDAIIHSEVIVFENQR